MTKEARRATPRADPSATRLGEPAWMSGFGKLRHLRAETARIRAAIDAEFGKVEAGEEGKPATLKA